MLPFGADAYLASFEPYNRAFWPLAILAYALGLAAVALVLRPIPGGGRWIAGGLAASWLWIGIAYHLLHFAAINFVAPVFAVAFVLEGLLIAWAGLRRGGMAFRFRRDAADWAGLGLMIAALVLHPGLAWLSGDGVSRAALFGIAPAPTVIFTLGLLLLREGRSPLWLMAIPLLWCAVDGITLWRLGLWSGLILPVAGALTPGLALLKNRRQG